MFEGFEALRWALGSRSPCPQRPASKHARSLAILSNLLGTVRASLSRTPPGLRRPGLDGVAHERASGPVCACSAPVHTPQTTTDRHRPLSSPPTAPRGAVLRPQRGAEAAGVHRLWAAPPFTPSRKMPPRTQMTSSRLRCTHFVSVFNVQMAMDPPTDHAEHCNALGLTTPWSRRRCGKMRKRSCPASNTVRCTASSQRLLPRVLCPLRKRCWSASVCVRCTALMIHRHHASRHRMAVLTINSKKHVPELTPNMRVHNTSVRGAYSRTQRRDSEHQRLPSSECKNEVVFASQCFSDDMSCKLPWRSIRCCATRLCLMHSLVEVKNKPRQC